MEIRLVKTDELLKLQRFLHDYWQPNHILSVNKDLMDYQHYNGESYNFVAAFENSEILCALGFIPTSQYDPEINRTDIWLAIWKKSDREMPHGTGTKLLDYLEKTFCPDTIGGIGINDKIEQLYLSRGWKSGILNHYYLPNIGRIASYEASEPLWIGIGNGFYNNSIPQKSRTYLTNRYELHPFYHYHLYNIKKCLFVIRKIWVKQSSCLRIVDIVGELPENIQYNLQNILVHYGADYIDCLNYGIPKEKFLKSGMYEKPDNLILPNWFEPLKVEHHPIKFAYKGPDNYVIYKGDSDQDRPNQL